MHATLQNMNGKLHQRRRRALTLKQIREMTGVTLYLGLEFQVMRRSLSLEIVKEKFRKEWWKELERDLK